MKLIFLVFLLPLALCGEINSETDDMNRSTGVVQRGLQDDLKEFVDLIPMNKIMSVALNYIVADKEVQALYNYIRSEEFRELYTAAIKTSAVRELIEILESYGLPVVKYINQITPLLMLPTYPQRMSAEKAPTKGVNGLVDEILHVLPRDKLIGLFIRKTITSPDFRQLLKNLGSEQTLRAVIKFASNKEVRRAYAELNKRGVDIVTISKKAITYFLNLC
uniref:Microvillar-like protein n=1 Tax=Lutzomyia longipalpis TaxID=7200 RepID=A8CW44_LUTLO|nr:microvillar-like protein [Lutzomyia longipalpis]